MVMMFIYPLFPEKERRVKIKSQLDRGCERRKGPNVEVGK
jgi:hypothetical protein